jgi:hypothetical protein
MIRAQPQKRETGSQDFIQQKCVENDQKQQLDNQFPMRKIKKEVGELQSCQIGTSETEIRKFSTRKIRSERQIVPGIPPRSRGDTTREVTRARTHLGIEELFAMTGISTLSYNG